MDRPATRRPQPADPTARLHAHDLCVDGFRLRVCEWRSASPRTRAVLALHGFGADGFRTYRYLAEPLAQRGVPLAALDLLGAGDSDKPEPFVYGLRRHARLIAAAAVALGLHRPVLVGHSMGGKIAAAAAALAPERYAGLGLINAGGFSRVGRLLPLVAGLGLTAYLFQNPTFYDRLLPRTPLGPVFPSADARAEFLRLRHSHAALDLDVAGIRPLLRRLPLPTLILWGRDDPLLPPRVARRAAAQLPRSALHWIPEAGHAPMKDQPTATAAALADFVKAHAPL